MSSDTGAVSRRSFMRRAAIGAGGTAATLGTGGLAFSESEEASGSKISVPKEILEQVNAPLPEIDFPMTGADVFGRACKEEGLAALFCSFDSTSWDPGLFWAARRFDVSCS